MKTSTGLRYVRMAGLFVALFTGFGGCKKDDPLEACRPAQSGGGGIGPGTSANRTVMFWIAQDFNCGSIQLVSLRNTETNDNGWNTSNGPLITKYFSAQPACGTSGTITVQVTKGYVYEYALQCSGRQWKAKLTADCFTSTALSCS